MSPRVKDPASALGEAIGNLVEDAVRTIVEKNSKRIWMRNQPY